MDKEDKGGGEGSVEIPFIARRDKIACYCHHERLIFKRIWKEGRLDSIDRSIDFSSFVATREILRWDDMIYDVSNDILSVYLPGLLAFNSPPLEALKWPALGEHLNASENGVPWSQPDPVSTDCFVLAPDCVKYLPGKVYAAKCVRETLFHGRAWNTQRADYSAVTNSLSFGTGCGREGRKDFLARCSVLSCDFPFSPFFSSFFPFLPLLDVPRQAFTSGEKATIERIEKLGFRA